MIHGLNLAFFLGPKSFVALHQDEFLHERHGETALEVTAPMIAYVAATVSLISSK